VNGRSGCGWGGGDGDGSGGERIGGTQGALQDLIFGARSRPAGGSDGWNLGRVRVGGRMGGGGLEG
jgi:hypothetical protein